MNTMCIICKYNAKSDRIRSMMRISDMLKRSNLDTRMVKKYRQFNWGSNDRCHVGLTCDRVNQNRQLHDTYSNELNVLLSAFIEQSNDERTFHEILYWLRGKFPSVYVYFEREYKMNHSS